MQSNRYSVHITTHALHSKQQVILTCTSLSAVGFLLTHCFWSFNSFLSFLGGGGGQSKALSSNVRLYAHTSEPRAFQARPLTDSAHYTSVVLASGCLYSMSRQTSVLWLILPHPLQGALWDGAGRSPSPLGGLLRAAPNMWLLCREPWQSLCT